MDKNQIIEIEKHIIQSTIQKDIKALDVLYSEDYQYINSSGEIITKQYLFDAIISNKVQYTSIEIKDEIIRFSSKTAILIASLYEKGIFEGIQFNEVFKLTRVYIEGTNGKIHVIGSHLTKLIQEWVLSINI